MKIIKTKFKDLLIFKSKNYKDKRGLLRELSMEKHLKKRLIFSLVSKSKKNVLRGLHMQRKNMQGKYLSVLKGRILDVVVDCRVKSKNFGKHFKIVLSEKNATSIYIPPGFAHGFLTLDKENIVLYSCTNYRNKESEVSIAWNDKDLKIKWPTKKPILSKKDSTNKSFRELNLNK
jgi:dTDP-4-dehydrorhamnose 3,5-epimerase